jgi:hypothetical protein
MRVWGSDVLCEPGEMAEFGNQVQQLLEGSEVGLVELAVVGTVDIQHSDHPTLEVYRQHYFRFGNSAACHVALECVHVLKHDGLVVDPDVSADSRALHQLRAGGRPLKLSQG